MRLDFTADKLLPKAANAFEEEVLHFLTQWNSAQATIEVQTSGSTGAPKILRVERKRMLASAQLTCDFLGLKSGATALLCLPIQYISGKMMVVRALSRRLKLVIATPGTTPLNFLNEKIDFCALTPLQVENSLDKLHLIRNLIIGGAAVSQALKDKIHAALSGTKEVRVFETYGMSETLSHIALKEIFPKSAPAFSVFPGISISQDNRGCLVIDAPQLHTGKLVTNDLVEIEEGGTGKIFRFLGRTDSVINSGGLKISPEPLEELLRGHLSQEIVFIGRPHPTLGEELVLVIEGKESEDARKQALQIPYPNKNYRPRQIIFVKKLPRLPNGKIDRLFLKKLVST